MSHNRAADPPELGPVWAEPRWWSIGYAVRVACAVIAASVIVGAVVGPGMLLIIRVLANADGMRLWYPPSMYWEAAGIHLQIGLLIAGGTSFFAVLLGTRRNPRAITLRVLSGPIVAGSCLSILSLAWGSWPGLLGSLAATAFAGAVFLAATFVARLTHTDRRRPRTAASE